MKAILSIIISGALVVLGYAQTRNVLVGTNNTVVQPTNFWSADASNARVGLGLGTAATNPATAFQSSSSVLSNLASSNAINLTNLRATNIVGVISSSNIPTVSLTNISGTLALTQGGTGATNAGGARTNLGLTLAALTNISADTFRTSINLGTNNNPTFSGIFITNFPSGVSRVAITPAGLIAGEGSGTNATTIGFQGISFSSDGAAGLSRTNLGLGWPALTNTNAGTGLVSVNTNGEVVSPTNFWQVSPANTRVQVSQPVVSATNSATNARNLYLYSLAISTIGVTNTIQLPTNGGTLLGDVATIIHEGPTSSVTAIRQIGAGTNLITLNQFQEAVKFIYESGGWRLADNISQVEPIYFSGTNAAANAAASRTNLGLGATWLTNTNVTNFRTAIGLGATNTVDFNAINGLDRVVFSDPLTMLQVGSTPQGPRALIVRITNSEIGYFSVNGFTLNTPINFYTNTQAAITRTNLGLGATNDVSFGSVFLGDITLHSYGIDGGGFNGQLDFEENQLYTGDGDWSFEGSGIINLGTLDFYTASNAFETRANLGVGSQNIVTFAGITNNGDIRINQTTATNGLLYVYRTNNEPFLGIANLIASNNTTLSNETLFRVGVSEATNKAAQFGFRSTNTNGNGVAVFSVFGFNALMMIGPSDPAAGTNPIQATVSSINPTNRVMTLITTNTGAMQMHRPIEWDNTTNSAVTRTNLGLGNGVTTNLDIKLDNNAGMRLYFSNGILTNAVTPIP